MNRPLLQITQQQLFHDSLLPVILSIVRIRPATDLSDLHERISIRCDTRKYREAEPTMSFSASGKFAYSAPRTMRAYDAANREVQPVSGFIHDEARNLLASSLRKLA